MLWRFSLYGFLKNQRYFEPFLLLALRSLDLSFFVIGLLIAFREVTLNLLEIPSGAVADLWGRRRAMKLSFSAYILSFLLFGMTIEWAGAGGLSRVALIALLMLSLDRKSTRLNSSHIPLSRMPSSA